MELDSPQHATHLEAMHYGDRPPDRVRSIRGTLHLSPRHGRRVRSYPQACRGSLCGTVFLVCSPSPLLRDLSSRAVGGNRWPQKSEHERRRRHVDSAVEVGLDEVVSCSGGDESKGVGRGRESRLSLEAIPAAGTDREAPPSRMGLPEDPRPTTDPSRGDHRFKHDPPTPGAGDSSMATETNSAEGHPAPGCAPPVGP